MEEQVIAVLNGPVGKFLATHPLIGIPLAAIGVIVLVLAVVGGFIKPEEMKTPRTRAAARLVHRYGIALRKSGEDWKALVTNVDPPEHAPTGDTDPPPPRPEAVSASWHDPPPVQSLREPPPLRLAVRPPASHPVPREDHTTTARDIPPVVSGRGGVRR